MNRKVLLPIATVFLTYLSTCTASPVPQETIDLRSRLDMKVSDYSLQQPNFVAALISLASDFKLPMGIEWVRGAEAPQAVNLSWSDVTVRKILGDVVKTQRGFGYDASRAFVHVFATDIVKDPRNFLNIRIDRFVATNQMPGIINRKLRAVVKHRMNPSRPAALASGEAGSYATGLPELPITIDLEDTPVRDVLGQIVASSVFRIWIATFEIDTKSHLPRAVSLWNPLLSREEQPVWDLTVWGRLPSALVSK